MGAIRRMGEEALREGGILDDIGKETEGIFTLKESGVEGSKLGEGESIGEKRGAKTGDI